MEPAGYIMVCRASTAFVFWTDTLKARNIALIFLYWPSEIDETQIFRDIPSQQWLNAHNFGKVKHQLRIH